MQYFPMIEGQVPYLTTQQMVEVDRVMVEDFRIELMQMMENAGRNLALLAGKRFLDGDPSGKRVAILAGSGGNGGGALVCARHLHNWGGGVQILLAKPEDRFTGVPAHQLGILRRLGVKIGVGTEDQPDETVALVIDGIIGYSLQGAPRQAAAGLIRWANEQSAPILALDIPSGLDATSGNAHDLCIRAAATMTLALPKTGFRNPEARQFTGELYLADISVPPEVYATSRLGLRVGNIFAKSEIVQLAI